MKTSFVYLFSILFLGCSQNIEHKHIIASIRLEKNESIKIYNMKSLLFVKYNNDSNSIKIDTIINIKKESKEISLTLYHNRKKIIHHTVDINNCKTTNIYINRNYADYDPQGRFKTFCQDTYSEAL